MSDKLTRAEIKILSGLVMAELNRLIREHNGRVMGTRAELSVEMEAHLERRRELLHDMDEKLNAQFPKAEEE